MTVSVLHHHDISLIRRTCRKHSLIMNEECVHDVGSFVKCDVRVG